MRHVWVRYRESGAEDAVNEGVLSDLLHRKAIQQFFRPSETQWVTVGVDPIRGAGGSCAGPERRCLPLIPGETTTRALNGKEEALYQMLRTFSSNNRKLSKLTQREQ